MGQRSGWGIFLLGILAWAPSAQAYDEPVIQVGIIQRFGARTGDRLNLKALPGDQLTLEFQDGNQPKTLRTPSITLEITQQSLPEPLLEERLVLSTHRSFESAEDSAQQWQAQGLEVEIAQPDTWQVWAKRDTYSTPLLRRLLLQQVKAQGDASAYLESKTLPKRPKTAWTLQGNRYQRDQLKITTQNGIVQVNQDRYAGMLQLQPNAYGTYTLVNAVPIEQYLRGVVPHEIGADAPTAAIEAQAVLARTYALRNLRRFAIDGYELCADTQCQVYQGLEGTARRTDAAIDATRGQVLTYQNELVDALYSSTTGGVTAPFSDVWDGFSRPYLKAVVDSIQSPGIWDLAARPLSDEQNFRAFIQLKQGFNEVGWWAFRWREESSLAEMNLDLRRYLEKRKQPLAHFRTIQQVQVIQRSTAGRVQQIKVSTDRGDLLLKKDEILRAFHAPNSTFFYLDPIRNPDQTLWGYAFVGGGFGHGVGLSQTGSYHLAEKGRSYLEILDFYYPGTQLQLLHPGITYWREPSNLRGR